MLPEQAKALESYKKARQQARVDTARERVEQIAHARGLDMALVKRTWKAGADLLNRRLAAVRTIASRPRAEIERAYPCTRCRILYDDSYKASCQSARLVPCFVKATLKGCPDLVPRLVVGGPGTTATPATPQAPVTTGANDVKQGPGTAATTEA